MPEPEYLADPSPQPQNEYGDRGVVPIIRRDGEFRAGQRIVQRMSLGKDFQIDEAGINPLRTVILTAPGGSPRATNGCGGPTRTDTGTNDVNIMSLDFDPTSTEYAQWTIDFPRNYDGGTINAQFVWTRAGTSTNGVAWGIQARSFGDGDDLDFPFGTAVVTVDSAVATTYSLARSPRSAPVTINGNPGLDSMTQIQVYRDTANSSDTLSVDALLLAVKLSYRIKRYSD